MNRKQSLIDALHTFINQRPGLEFGNYGDVSAYRSEMRDITRALNEARTMLSAIAWRDSITADMLIDASKRAFSGRLSITENDGRVSIDYCTGQYWPTEYRRAVCSVLASLLWHYWRENAPADAGVFIPHSNLHNVGDYIRKTARAEFGRGIASRYFN